MACIHLTQLYQLCEKHQLQFSSSHLVRIICKECGSEDVCPSMLTNADLQDDVEPSPDTAPQDPQAPKRS